MKGLRIFCSIMGGLALLFAEIHVPDNPTILDVTGALGILGIVACMLILPWAIEEKK